MCYTETPIVWTTVTDRRVRIGGVAEKQLGFLTAMYKSLIPLVPEKALVRCWMVKAHASELQVLSGKCQLLWSHGTLTRYVSLDTLNKPNKTGHIGCAAFPLSHRPQAVAFGGQAPRLALSTSASPSGVYTSQALLWSRARLLDWTHSSWRTSTWLFSQTWGFGCCEPSLVGAFDIVGCGRTSEGLGDWSLAFLHCFSISVSDSGF